MIIDKNGRLFSKVSVIDALIVVLIIAAVFFLAARYLSSANTTIGAGGSLEELEIKFYSEEVNKFVVDAIQIDDAAKEFAQYANFGVVTNVEIEDSITWVGDYDGHIYPSSKDGYYNSVTVTTHAKGKINDIGFELDGTTYFVGKTVIMQFGKAGFQGRIAGVDRVSDVEAGAVSELGGARTGEAEARAATVTDGPEAKKAGGAAAAVTDGLEAKKAGESTFAMGEGAGSAFVRGLIGHKV